MKLGRQCILSISIFMILISNIFVGASQVFINNSDEGVESTDAELPVWSIGDFWEYDFKINIAGIVIFDATRVDLLVTNDDGSEYTVKIYGFLDKLKVANYDYSIFLKAAYLEGIAHIDKKTLSTIDYSITITANMHSPIDLKILINLIMEFNPKVDSYNFPMVVGKQWNLNSNVNFSINGYVRESGADVATFDEFSPNNPLIDDISVLTKEILSVKAGSYDSYLISGGLGNPSELWYSPEIGYLVKVDQLLPKFLKIYILVNFGCYLELLSTNFNYPENNAPETPNLNGPISGNIKEEYECTVKTTDPNGEQVYYKIDWGDGSTTDWIGPYDSGDEITIRHKFNGQAEYKIRVKAKDINGYQTAWTYPLTVTMPRNKLTTTILLSSLKNHLNMLSLLPRLLKF